VAAVALVVVIVLIAVGVNSCQSSARKSALQDYANTVNSLVNRSFATSNSLFGVLSSGVNASNVTSKSQDINQTRLTAESELKQAQGLSVPSAAKTANSNLLSALKLRLDGITNIATEIQPALGTSVNREAVSQIAGEMARFYASDVLYKDYAAPAIVSALHANHIAVGGADGAPINPHQFLPSINWLRPSFVAAQLNVSLPSTASSGKVSPGLHGHSLTSVSVGGTTLEPGATNTVAASPTPTFTIDFVNGGASNETDVTCKVTVTGQGVSGTKVVPETFAGKSASCAVTLSTSPPRGTSTVEATIERVPGEKNLSNNTQSYPVTFN
jgi:hypothetical protein